MAAFCRTISYFIRNVPLMNQNRNISLSKTTYLKEFIEKKEGNNLVIEAVIKPDKNEERLLKPKNGACILCSTEIDLKHTDILILSQFTRSNGSILPRRITGLCKVQQKRISSMILMAQSAGLLPMRGPDGKFLHPLQRRKWRKFNTYYDENTIKAKYWR